MAKEVEKFRLNKKGKDYLKRVKAMYALRSLLAMKKKQNDLESAMLGNALGRANQGLMQAMQVPGEQLMNDVALMEEDHA